MKVMVVDDSKTMRLIIVSVLGEMGITDVEQADSGDTGHYIAVRNKVDLILLDWNMPKMSGLEFLRNLRAQAQTASIPVIMVTTEGEREKVLQASTLGIEGFVVKPFKPETLIQKIHDFCRKRALPLPMPKDGASAARDAKAQAEDNPPDADAKTQANNPPSASDEAGPSPANPG